MDKGKTHKQSGINTNASCLGQTQLWNYDAGIWNVENLRVTYKANWVTNNKLSLLNPYF